MKKVLLMLVALNGVVNAQDIQAQAQALAAQFNKAVVNPEVQQALSNFDTVNSLKNTLSAIDKQLKQLENRKQSLSQKLQPMQYQLQEDEKQAKIKDAIAIYKQIKQNYIINCSAGTSEPRAPGIAQITNINYAPGMTGASTTCDLYPRNMEGDDINSTNHTNYMPGSHGGIEPEKYTISKKD